MTEEAGFAEPEEAPETPAADAPATDEAAEPEAAEDVTEPPEVVTATKSEPEPVPAPWLPDEGVPDAIRSAIQELSDRIGRLGG